MLESVGEKLPSDGGEVFGQRHVIFGILFAVINNEWLARQFRQPHGAPPGKAMLGRDREAQ